MLDSAAYSLETPTRERVAVVPLPAPAHLKVTGAAPAFGFERCEDVGCRVDVGGTASSCGRLACPACGCGGTNLEVLPLLDEPGIQVHCSCGHDWLREERLPGAPARIALSL
jgi:hypothetical protein